MTKPFAAVISRELTEDDIASLEKIDRGSKAPTVKALRQRHHKLARALAEGMPEIEAAIHCDYSLSRVSILKSDPAFMELIQFYMQRVNVQYEEFHAKLATLGDTAVSVLIERVEDDPDAIETSELRKLAEFASDRTGYGPTKNVDANVTIGFAARLEAARARRKAHEASNVIEGEVLKDE